MPITQDREGKAYNEFTREYEEKEYTIESTELNAETKSEPLPEVDLTEAVYGEKWQEIVERAVYAPTRFEYFVGLALQGLVTGRAERDLKTAVRKSLDLAREVETLLDKTED